MQYCGNASHIPVCFSTTARLQRESFDRLFSDYTTVAVNDTKSVFHGHE